MTWINNLTRIRRFLRDPDGNIWADALLLNLFNDVSREFQMKTNILEDVEAVHVPPLYACSYLHDWEWTYLPSKTGSYRALRYHEQGEIAVCSRWEAQASWGLVSATDADEGIHATQPWEYFMGHTPGDLVPLPFPRGFHNAKFVAWDKEPIDAITVKEIQLDDPSWVGRTGEPFAYFRPDKFEDNFCLYPIPSSVDWGSVETPIVADPLYVFTYSFEEADAYIEGDGQNATREDTVNLRQYLFDFELDNGAKAEDVTMRGMWMFEMDGVRSYGIGMTLHLEGESVNSNIGTILDFGGLGSGTGIVTDAIDADENVLFVFTKTPTALVSHTDESEFPDFLQKYIEQGTIERAYGVNNDGKIQSLRDYWNMRKEIGLKAIKKFQSLKKQDRDYRFVTKGAPGFRTNRQPRLPDSYPAVM